MAVHPRLRGELVTAIFVMIQLLGSSPLTRGTHQTVSNPQGLIRFIPAYAGNSVRRDVRAYVRAVHPRLRGELLYC